MYLGVYNIGRGLPCGSDIEIKYVKTKAQESGGEKWDR